MINHSRSIIVTCHCQIDVTDTDISSAKKKAEKIVKKNLPASFWIGAVQTIDEVAHENI